MRHSLIKYVPFAYISKTGWGIKSVSPYPKMLLLEEAPVVNPKILSKYYTDFLHMAKLYLKRSFSTKQKHQMFCLH